MTKKIKCEAKTKKQGNAVRVRIVKAPYVNQNDLKQFIVARARALVI